MNDSCPECLARDVKPDRIREEPGTVVALYTCPDCPERWSCSWDAASLPAATMHDLKVATYAGQPGRTPR